jgi:hypothetical protein
MATAEPTLLAANIKFHTNDDDKNEDTHLTVVVRDEEGNIAARIDDDFGLFKDQSDSGPFDLELLNKAQKVKLRSGTVEIRIDPENTDVWKFNYFLDLLFTDESHLTSEAQGLRLSEVDKQQQFAIA